MTHNTLTMCLLIVEDDAEWQEELESWFQIEAKDQGLYLEIKIASTTQDAKEALRERQYHALSIDQNMPDAKGGDVSSMHGKIFAETVSRSGIPVFAAMYTGYPNIETANEIGRNTGIDYKIKSSESEENGLGLTPRDYVKWFLTKFKRVYLKRVLQRAAASGYKNMAEFARLASDDHDKALDGGRQDVDVSRFMSRLNSVREELLRNLVAMTMGLLTHAELDVGKAPRLEVSHSVEDWLKTHWDHLENDETFVSWTNFMGIPESLTMSQYFLNSAMELRLERNRVSHDKKIDYSYEDYQKLYPAIIRLAYLLTYFVTRRLINRPYAPRPGILSYTEMRGTHSEPLEMQYNRPLPDDKDPKLIYMQIIDGGPLVPLAPGIMAERDTKNRLKLVCPYGGA